jgi:hypothetical protein
MKKMTLTAWLLLVIAAAAACAASGQPPGENGTGGQWLATGIVTRTTPVAIYLLGKDSVIYRIDTRQARIHVSGSPGRLSDIQVGDKVRVFGRKTGSKDVRAVQMNVLGSAPQVEPAPPAPEAYPPSPEVAPPAPAAPLQPDMGAVVPPQEQTCQSAPSAPCPGRGPAVTEPSYRGRGLIKDLHLTEGWMTLLTNEGPINVDFDNARILDQGKATSFSELSIGDAVNVVGDYVATGKVAAATVDIVGDKSAALSAPPVNAASAVGTITGLDYSAFTFVIDSPDNGSIFVTIDEKTDIKGPGGKIMGFRELMPAAKVKVSGTGSAGTGILAQQIVVIGSPR